MKKVYLILVSILVLSCTEPKYVHIGQTIIDGKVSATQEATYGRGGRYAKIWVQNSTSTQEVEIPNEFDGRWKVGDSCLLIIEKYEIIKEE